MAARPLVVLCRRRRQDSAGKRVANKTSSTSRGVAVKVNALFGKKKPEPPPPPPPPPPPKGPFGGLFGKQAPQQQQQQQQQVRDVEYVPQETMTDAYARVRKQREKGEGFEAKEKGGISLFMARPQRRQLRRGHRGGPRAPQRGEAHGEG